jgi:two-component system chemotaxis response regulator CheB
MRDFKAIVIGCSSGGLQALQEILSAIPENFSFPLAIVQHLNPDSGGILAAVLGKTTKITVKEAEDKEPLLPGTAYVAPPNYHLLIEGDSTFSLSVDEKESHSRPSIDVLFESAADVYGSKLVGIILTGGNADGALGLKKIHKQGGLTIVQEPSTAIASEMPKAALKLMEPDRILHLDEIGSFLATLKSMEIL